MIRRTGFYGLLIVSIYDFTAVKMIEINLYGSIGRRYTWSRGINEIEFHQLKPMDEDILRRNSHV